MNDTQILQDYSSLPEYLRREAADFISFLKQKTKNKDDKAIRQERDQKSLGISKGKLISMDNFDDPIPVWKDIKL